MKIVLSNNLSISNAPSDLKEELMNRLQFVNPKWIENNRLGRWNRGTTRILKFYRKGPHDRLIIPRGMMRQLILLSREQGLKPDIEDRRRKLGEVAFSFRGELKPFQLAAVEEMSAREFGTLSAPTGSGKTVMALSLIARRRQPAVIVVHSKELADQWVERVQTFLGIPKKDIGLIAGGRMRMGEGGVTVAMVQSLYKCAAEASLGCGYLVVDECHRAPSRTFTEAVTAFDSNYMLGLSATPWRRDQLSKLIFWHLGDLHHEVAKIDLVARGDILPLTVIERPTEFKPYHDPVAEYSRMLSELTADDARNRLIASDVAAECGLSQSGVCLVLSDRRHHCETLQLLLRHRHQIEADVLTGELSAERRREVIERLKRKEIQVLIATGQLIGEGFDCPGLATLFLTTPIRFSGRLLQYLGRVLRPSEGVECARLFDYIDTHVAPLKAAALARRQIYASGR